jgi:hypothetical protein
MLHAYEHAADAFTSTAEERAAEPLSWWEKRIANPQGMRAALGVHREGRLIATCVFQRSWTPDSG